MLAARFWALVLVLVDVGLGVGVGCVVVADGVGDNGLFEFQDEGDKVRHLPVLVLDVSA